MMIDNKKKLKQLRRAFEKTEEGLVEMLELGMLMNIYEAIISHPAKIFRDCAAAQENELVQACQAKGEGSGDNCDKCPGCSPAGQWAGLINALLMQAVAGRILERPDNEIFAAGGELRDFIEKKVEELRSSQGEADA